MFGKGFEFPLSGSMVRFKKRPPSGPRSPDDEQRELEKKMFMNKGIDVLRKIRGRIFTEVDPKKQQSHLKESHDLADELADYILLDGLGKLNIPKNHPYPKHVLGLHALLADTSWDTKRAIVPSHVIQNLRNATQDLLIGVEELTKSLDQPIRRLSQTEMTGVLTEFLKGTNGLYLKEATKHFFDKDARAGGILSGGLVYLLIVKKIVERYGEEGLAIQSFAIAVNQDNKRCICEMSEKDTETTHVYVLDDMVDTGGTILRAWQSVGEHFPNAYIYSEKGIESPGSWQKRAKEKIMEELARQFYDFADAVEEERLEDAQRMYAEAKAFAEQNKVGLQRGWLLRKAKLDKKLGTKHT